MRLAALACTTRTESQLTISSQPLTVGCGPCIVPNLEPIPTHQPTGRILRSSGRTGKVFGSPKKKTEDSDDAKNQMLQSPGTAPGAVPRGDW